jgi:hypothetical protein
LLSRQHLFQQVPEIWDLITAHNERCNLFTVRQALTKVGEGEESSGDYLFEALHFDHYLREMLTKDWDLTTAATELLLGRPLTDYLKACGFKASLSPEGVFRLEHRKDCLSSPSTL